MLKKLRKIVVLGAALMGAVAVHGATTRYVELRSTLQPNTTGANAIFVSSGSIRNLTASTMTVSGPTTVGSLFSNGNLQGSSGTISGEFSVTGNLGIGKVPAQKLDLTGAANGDSAIRADLRNTGTGAMVILSSSNANNLQMISYGSGTTGNFVTGIVAAGLGVYFSGTRGLLDSTLAQYINTESANPIVMRTNNTERFTINTSTIVSTLPIYFPDGSGSAPSQTFTSSNTAGRYWDGSSIRDRVGGIDAAIFYSTGVVLRANTNGATAPVNTYGEVISSFSVANISMTGNNQYTDIASITLTGGAWAISVMEDINSNGATVTDGQCGIGTAAGNSSAGLVLGDNATQLGSLPSATVDSFCSVPSYIVRPTSGTTYYLKTVLSYSVATPRAKGRISAVRIY